MHPQHVGKYEILSPIGENERGTVFRARDPEQNREVALKLLKSQSLYTMTAERAFNEMAEKLRQLEHPAIVPVLDYGDENNRPFIVMPLMEGGSLGDRLEAGTLSLEEIVQTFTPLAQALDFAAQRGILHMDLKPNNVLFDERGQPYLADLGVVQIVDALSAARVPQVNPFYTSPEQVRKHGMDIRSNVYSLAALIYHALTGQPLFSGVSEMVTAFKHISQRPQPPRQLRPELPAAVDEVMLRALEKKPEDRYPSASEFLRGLDAAAGGKLTPGVVERQTEARPAQAEQPQPMRGAVAPLAGAPLAREGAPPASGRTAIRVSLLLLTGFILVCTVGAIMLGNLISMSETFDSTPTPNFPATQSAQATETAANTLRQTAASWPIVLADSFDQNINDWRDGVTSDEYANIVWNIDGQYVWTVTANQGFVWQVWPEMAPQSDFYLSVQAQQLSGTSDTQYGVTFRNDESTNNYYLFDLTNQQQYSFWVHFNDEWFPIIDSSFSEAIIPGAQNQIEIVAQDSHFTFFINGQYVAHALDDRLSSGTIGLEVGMNREGDQAVIAFDEFTVRVP